MLERWGGLEGWWMRRREEGLLETVFEAVGKDVRG